VVLRRTRLIDRRLVGVAITATLVLTGLLSGCAGKKRDAGAAAAVVHVTVQDFKVSAPKVLPRGDVTILARNRGPDDHELIVVREQHGRLPFRRDGITIDEDALEAAKAGVLEPFESGTVDRLHVRLAPGRYVLFCNMAGHFLGGMHTTVVVRGR
jgi:uncharacterized cupredoxin-like copper-binding protein